MSTLHRLPPHDLGAERALIGAMLLHAPAIDIALETVAASDFYRPAYTEIFRAIESLHGRGDPADPTTVETELRRRGSLETINGTNVLAEAVASTPTTSSAGRYAKTIAECAELRRLNEAGAEIAELCFTFAHNPETAAAEAHDILERHLKRASPSRAGRDRFTDGASWIFDQAENVPAVWGDQEDRRLWSPGEPLLIVGPPGVGKTTLMQQLVAGRLGLLDELLGFPVAAAEEPVLYLACDRPKQIRRAFARLVTPADRQVVADRLVVWEGPPPHDFARHPRTLVDMARSVGAGTVIIDSLKDVAIGLNDDEVGAGLNRALQETVAAGIEVAALHHQRKGQNGARPKALEDVYGSTWITAGAGSVILLWGAAGDPVVELVHLKQPAGTVGPLEVEHDHNTGRSTVAHGPADPLTVLRQRRAGLTAPDLALVQVRGGIPSKNDVQRARRALDALVKRGLATKEPGALGGAGGTSPDLYRATQEDRLT